MLNVSVSTSLTKIMEERFTRKTSSTSTSITTNMYLLGALQGKLIDE